MTLELARFAQSLTRIGDATVSQQRRNAELATLARRTMERAPSVEEIAAVVKNSRRGESLAVPLEPPATTHQPPDALAPYTVLGVDGSHHELDRYSAAACAVVNLGGWRIRYGDFPEAEQLYDMRVLTGETHPVRRVRARLAAPLRAPADRCAIHYGALDVRESTIYFVPARNAASGSVPGVATASALALVPAGASLAADALVDAIDLDVA